MMDTAHYMMMYQAECCTPSSAPVMKEEEEEEVALKKKKEATLALPETMADTINEMLNLDDEYGVSTNITTTTTTTTTTTIITTETIKSVDPNPLNIVNLVKVTPTEQYDENGRPYEEPIPREFLPPLPILSTGEEWQDDVVTQEEFDEVHLSMNLPSVLPEKKDAVLAASHVPINIVHLSKDFIIYMTTRNKPANDIGKARDVQAKLSPTLMAFYEQFGVYAEDRDRKLTNWKTVYYVTHLLRTIPTNEAYRIDDDLFSGSQGMHEYTLDNWHASRTHAIRMAVISHLSGDYVEAVYTLDLLMRFRRSMNRRSHCITFHKIYKEGNNGVVGEGKKIPRNQSLCFVSYLNDEGDVRASWINVGLNEGVVVTQPYYDGPYCKTCNRHHISLIFCTECYCTQYCNLACLKKDKALHAPLCRRNKRL